MKTLCYRGVPVLGFAAFSGVGKTTTLKHLIPALVAARIRVAIVKHTHHGLEIDHKGKDSYQLREAGATQIVVGSNQRRAVIIETPETQDVSLSSFLANLEPQRCDIIMVEGFRHHAFPKVEIYRDVDKALLAASDDNVIAIFADREIIPKPSAVQLELNDVTAQVSFVMQYISKAKNDLNGTG